MSKETACNIRNYFLDILHHVEARENPPFRPDVSGRDCPDDLLELMERCWADIPDERPSFEIIRGIIRRIMKLVSLYTS